MIKKDKELLLKDLCARSLYNVKVLYNNKVFNVDYISAIYEEIKLDIPDDYTIDISEVKPYLFPLSSMTDEEKLEYRKTQWVYQADYCAPEYFDDLESYDWLNKNHFDYRGLIEKGLAIDATGLNIY